MAGLVTASELAGSGELASDLDTYTAEQAIARASAQVRSFCGWSISAETGVTRTVTGDGREIWLPTLNLTGVTSIVENGATVAAGGYWWTRNGRIVRRYANWLWEPAQAVVVTFDHGYSAVPDDVKSVAISLAARIYSGMTTGRRSLTVGGVTETYASGDEPGATLSAGERAALGPYQLVAV